MTHESDRVQEERVARVLRRRMRETPIPPFAAIEARSPRRAPLGVMVSTAVVTVVLALVAGNALAERRGVTPAAASPTGAAAVLNNRFGFVWAATSGLQVRSETGQSRFQLPATPYSFSLCSCAVSPDSTRIAYWLGNQPGGELRVVEVARPTQHATIYTAPATDRVSAAAWSSDGTGILFSIEGVNAVGGPDRGPTSSALLVIEASGGAARTLVDRDGPLFVPLGWDRQAGVAAAGESGPGGYLRGYVTVRTSGDPAPRRTTIAEDILVLSLDVSTDQAFVLGVVVDPTGRTLRWWKLADFAAMVNGPRIGSGVSPKWRPFSAQVGWIDSGRLQLLDVERDVRTTAGTFPGDYSLSAFRQDGSAVLAMTSGGPTTYVLLELTSGRSAGFNAAGTVAGSIRLP
jgi:hypothetical protein